MPAPEPGESKKEYVARCMAFPDLQGMESDQRFAVCNAKWQQAQEKNSMNDKNIERRFCEVRADDSGRKLSGYAAIFNSESGDLGGFREVIQPGAFAEALASNPDVRCLVNHEPNQILGRTSAGTLRLAEDSHGLKYEVDLPDTQAGRDIAASIKRGDISQSSFAFSLAPGGDSWRDALAGKAVRTITRVDKLFDVSPVTYPAYPDTAVALRSLEQATKPAEPVAEEKPVEWHASSELKQRRCDVLLEEIDLMAKD